MERLVTTSQAAEILGLSLQGIHYRIKKNQLKSIKKSGKTFVYIDDSMQESDPLIELTTTKRKQPSSNRKSYDDISPLIEAKDEQIVLLKKSIKLMRKQYISEINRLEKNQKRIIDVFNSEIKLLQSAFNEMRSVYSQPQIKQKKDKKESKKKDSEFISLKEFFILMKRVNKSDKEIKVLILKAIQRGDKRFIYNKLDKKLLILNDEFKDLV